MIDPSLLEVLGCPLEPDRPPFRIETLPLRDRDASDSLPLRDRDASDILPLRDRQGAEGEGREGVNSGTEPSQSFLICTSCGSAFPIKDGIPFLLPEDAIPPDRFKEMIHA